MGQVAAKAEQGTDSVTQRTEGKVGPESNAVNQLIEFMEKQYESIVQPANTFDEFYHAIYELIQKFCAGRGQVQYEIPSKQDLEKAYKDVNPKKGKLTKEQFKEIIAKVVRFDSFTFGKAAMHVLMVLFGAPVCALLAKRIVPGLKSLSDDVVIPMATSGAVVYLAKTKKL